MKVSPWFFCECFGVICRSLCEWYRQKGGMELLLCVENGRGRGKVRYDCWRGLIDGNHKIRSDAK